MHDATRSKRPSARIPFSGSLERKLIEQELEAAALFAVTSFEPPPGGSLYSTRSYEHHHRSGGGCIQALLDRNLVSPILHAARGHTLAKGDGPAKVAAALMAFTAAAGIDLEPSLALYEVAAKTSDTAAKEDLALFRIAEAVEPAAFEHLALGRMDRIAASFLSEARRRTRDDSLPPDLFTRPLTEWKRHQLPLTKLAVLVRQQPGLPGLTELIRWSAEEAYFDGLVLTLATILLSPRRDSRLLKGIHSDEGDKRIAGVDNAAWDLAYVSQVKAWSEVTPEHWLFCTADQPLQQLARIALGMTGSIEEIVRRYWPATDVDGVLVAHRRAETQSQRPWRERTPEERTRKFEQLQLELSDALAR